jgi:hypothetical protein
MFKIFIEILKLQPQIYLTLKYKLIAFYFQLPVHESYFS